MKLNDKDKTNIEALINAINFLLQDREKNINEYKKTTTQLKDGLECVKKLIDSQNNIQ